MFCWSAYSQVGINTITPNNQSVLEVNSSNQGILLPRVALLSTILPSPMSANVEGMIVYNTALNGAGLTAVFPGLYYNDGLSWIRFNPNTVKIGEIKHSFATADHNGWYLMDGRTTASIVSSTAKTNAAVIGIGANLPDATNRFLKAKTGAEVLGSSGGSNTFNIAQTNLPNINFTGSTDNTGAHAHDVDSYRGDESIELLSNVPLLTAVIVQAVAQSGISGGVSTIARTTQNAGNHIHTATVNTGGSGTAVDRTPNYLATNIFIYLGI